MVAKAFSIEDGNLSNRTLIGAKSRSYSDIDLTFAKKPSGDIFKKTEAAAVKQAVKNLLLTNRLEKPFTVDYGGHLNDFLFELTTDVDVDQLSDRIIHVVHTYEPRAEVLDVSIKLNPNNNQVSATVTFQVLSTNEVVELDVSLARLR